MLSPWMACWRSAPRGLLAISRFPAALPTPCPPSTARRWKSNWTSSCNGISSLSAGWCRDGGLSRSFFEAWSPFLDWLEGQPKELALRDYHSPNLLLCAERDGLARLGVIDFQDAVLAHPAYDLVSLLQDARLEVPVETERLLYARYCEGAAEQDAGFDPASFAKAYAILGAQRNTKIIGIFARLSMRDGKHGYLAHLPRIERYLHRGLAHPDLKPLRAWYEANLRPAAGGGFPPGRLG